MDHEPDPHSNTLLPACVESPLWRGAMRYTDKIIEWCLGSRLAIFMDHIMKYYQTPTRRRPFPPPSPRIRTSIKNACDMLIERTRGCASSFVAIEHELSEILGRLNEVLYTSGPVTKLVSNLFHLAQPHLRSSWFPPMPPVLHRRNFDCPSTVTRTFVIFIPWSGSRKSEPPPFFRPPVLMTSVHMTTPIQPGANLAMGVLRRLNAALSPLDWSRPGPLPIRPFGCAGSTALIYRAMLPEVWAMVRSNHVGF
jgi:hypothetical protein